MWQQMMAFLNSWFAVPNILGLTLAVFFGIVWLLLYRPPLFKQPSLWWVLLVSALLTLAAITFIQIPLQSAVGDLIGRNAMAAMLLVAAIPGLLIGGLVQEGAKLTPVVFIWARRGRKMDARTGLLIGAVAGAGFGVFEALWAHNMIFAAGWNWSVVQSQGFIGVAGFWERFFAVGFHIAVSAIAGYGLASGWGWQLYLLASLFHAVLNYNALLFQAHIFSVTRVEISIAILAVLVTAFALWLKYSSPPRIETENSTETETKTEA